MAEGGHSLGGYGCGCRPSSFSSHPPAMLEILLPLQAQSREETLGVECVLSVGRCIIRRPAED